MNPLNKLHIYLTFSCSLLSWVVSLGKKNLFFPSCFSKNVKSVEISNLNLRFKLEIST